MVCKSSVWRVVIWEIVDSVENPEVFHYLSRRMMAEDEVTRPNARLRKQVLDDDPPLRILETQTMVERSQFSSALELLRQFGEMEGF